MLCQLCQKRNANVHFTQIVNNKKIELYVCEYCANENGQINVSSPLNINDFFTGLIALGNYNPYVSPVNRDRMVCGKCGMSYEEFQRSGKLGCIECYEMYSERMKPMLKRLHGSTNHVGKLPAKVTKSIKNSKEIETLKEMLAKAIVTEEYEKAAEIRDKIKGLETK